MALANFNEKIIAAYYVIIITTIIIYKDNMGAKIMSTNKVEIIMGNLIMIRVINYTIFNVDNYKNVGFCLKIMDLGAMLDNLN